MRDEINWKRGNPDTPPAKLIGLLPNYHYASHCASKRKKLPKLEGKTAVSVKAGDRVHIFALPENVPMLTAKCAFRWYFKAETICGRDGNYVAMGAKVLNK